MSEVSKLKSEGSGCCAGLIEMCIARLVYKGKKMGIRTMIIIIYHVHKLINICLWIKGFSLYDVHTAVI